MTNCAPPCAGAAAPRPDHQTLAMSYLIVELQQPLFRGRVRCHGVGSLGGGRSAQVAGAAPVLQGRRVVAGFELSHQIQALASASPVLVEGAVVLAVAVHLADDQQKPSLVRRSRSIRAPCGQPF